MGTKVTKETFLSSEMILALEAIKGSSVVAKKLWENRGLSLTNEFMRNVHLRKDGSISYLPKGKDSEVAHCGTKWIIKNRQVCKPGVFARKWSKEWLYNFYDKDIEQFSNLLVAQASASQSEIKLVSGSDIKKYYHGKNYSDEENTGTLSGSCMRGNDSQYLMDFYRDNPHRIQLAVLFSKIYPSKIVGRALVWKTNLGFFMDRIYASDVNVKVFHTWAKKQGFMYKGMNNREISGNLITAEGKEVRLSNLFVSDLKMRNDGRSIPYLDTMCYLYPELGVVSPSSSLNSGWGLLGQNQNQHGSPSQIGVYCEDIGMFLPQDHTVCGYKNWTACIKGHGKYYPKLEMFFCDEANTWFHNSEIMIAWGGKAYPKDYPKMRVPDGEKIKLPVSDRQLRRNFADGKWYLSNTHVWKQLCFIPPSDSYDIEHYEYMLDTHVDEFLSKHGLTVDEHSNVRLPKSFSDFFRPKDGNDKQENSPASGEEKNGHSNEFTTQPQVRSCSAASTGIMFLNLDDGSTTNGTGTEPLPF